MTDYYPMDIRLRQATNKYAPSTTSPSPKTMLTAMVLSAATGSTNFDTATLSPVRLPSSHPKVVVFRDSRRASAATFVHEAYTDGHGQNGRRVNESVHQAIHGGNGETRKKTPPSYLVAHSEVHEIARNKIYRLYRADELTYRDF